MFTKLLDKDGDGCFFKSDDNGNAALQLGRGFVVVTVSLGRIRYYRKVFLRLQVAESGQPSTMVSKVLVVKHLFRVHA